MAAIPKKVEERLAENLKKYQPIIQILRDRDVNEADTVTFISDVLADLFGYDKYNEITREHAIRGTFVDLAIQVEGKLRLLIEVKAVGLELKDMHLRQAIDYAANEGVEWVVLTNGIIWRIYKVIFLKPINYELIFELNLLDLCHKTASHLELLFLLTREAIGKSALESYHLQKQATNKYTIAAILLNDIILNLIRRELRRVSPNVSINTAEIKTCLTEEVIKREIMESEQLKSSLARVKKGSVRPLRTVKNNLPSEASGDIVEMEDVLPQETIPENQNLTDN
ncbi:MAG: type I restriction enzyme HsdR N-terminal domain-containing protein [bacterium]